MIFVALRLLKTHYHEVISSIYWEKHCVSMSQSHLQMAADTPLKLSPDIFLLDPSNRCYTIGQSRLGSLLLKESFALLALIFLSGLFLATTVQELGPLFTNAQIQQCGTPVQGSVVAKRLLPGDGTVPDKCYLSYQFTTLLGEVVAGEQVIARSIYDQFQMGDSVMLKYLPENPQLSGVAGAAQDGVLVEGKLIVGSTSVASALIAAGALITLICHQWRKNQYFVHGQLLKGHVLSCRVHLDALPEHIEVWEKGAKYEGVFFIAVTYTFKSPTGKTIKAVATRQRNDLRRMPLPAFGQTVGVLYLSDGRYQLL
jgi:hypothetical protein